MQLLPQALIFLPQKSIFLANVSQICLQLLLPVFYDSGECLALLKIGALELVLIKGEEDSGGLVCTDAHCERKIFGRMDMAYDALGTVWPLGKVGGLMDLTVHRNIAYSLYILKLLFPAKH